MQDECYDREKPQHYVTLSAYKMDIYEVTVAEFKLCVNAGACSIDNFDNGNYNDIHKLNHPMNAVNWYGAKEYCNFVGKRLPTEAEWEYAARGINSTKYPWGNSDPTCEYAVFSICLSGGTSIVGTKPLGKSFFGVHDMAGNIEEWVEDYYSDTFYDLGAVTNPLNDVGSYRVLRGGRWTDNEIRSSSRHSYDPISTYMGYGFRCAKSQ